MFLDIRNFAATNLPQGRKMDDIYMRDYLVDLLPWHYLLRERLGALEYIDELKFEENSRKQIAAYYFPPNTQQGEGVGRIEIYLQTKKGNFFRRHFWLDILHEIGHATYGGLSHRSRFQREWLTVWGGTPSVFDDLRISNSISSDEEEFAQTYALYVQDGVNLKDQHLIRYSFMRKNVFIGREYEPEETSASNVY